MSGKPNQRGVEDVLTILETLEKNTALIQELEPQVEKLKRAKEISTKLNEELTKHLQKMDIESPGNAGFENRMGWFLYHMRLAIVGRRNEATQRAVDEIREVSGG